MVIETLTLHNFGLYRGEQSFDLRPTRVNGSPRPIVLFGGMNGAGKTTLFDAVQLALYGSRGTYSKRAKASYEDFLRDSITKGVDPSVGASVSLTFRIGIAGEQHLYEVCRSWTQRGRTMRERLHVHRDGVEDQRISEHWMDVVEEVIPLGISQLFFFDAEKIRFLAEDDTSTESLGNAIKSLLGLDLAERLIADAAILENRLAQRIQNNPTATDLLSLHQAIEEKEVEIRNLRSERAGLENHRLRAEKEQREAEEAFAKHGGVHWKKRDANVQQLATLEQKVVDVEAQLIQMSAGPAPLALIPELLQAVAEQDVVERKVSDATTIHGVLADRDESILKTLEKQRADKTFLTMLRAVQEQDRAARYSRTSAPQRLQLSESAKSQLVFLRSGTLDDACRDAYKAVEELQELRMNRDSLQRVLQQTPDDDSVAGVFERLTAAVKEFAVLDDRGNRLDAAIQVLTKERDEIERQLQKIRRSAVDETIASEEASRLASLAIRTQSTMREYLRRATAEKIDRLSAFITESFRFLLRKRTLVERVQIDPETFHITLFDTEGQPISKQRLSEGEKQIFAISVLWGLAQASPRPLPAIIDTPMARLDAEHRAHLVDRYFPNASHQVIILSTDTEVDESFYSSLTPSVARAYHLRYDDGEMRTVGEEGYFWNEQLLNAQQDALT